MNDDEVPLGVSLTLGNCSFSDNTPFYSELYNERFSLRLPISQKETLQKDLSSTDDGSQGKLSTPKATVEIMK